MKIKIKQATPNLPKNLDHRSHQYKFREKQIFKSSAVCFKSDIFLMSETNIDDSFPGSQFFAEGVKMYHEDRTKNGGEIFTLRKLKCTW